MTLRFCSCTSGCTQHRLPDVLTLLAGIGRSGPVSGEMQGGAFDSPGHRMPLSGAVPGRPVIVT